MGISSLWRRARAVFDGNTAEDIASVSTDSVKSAEDEPPHPAARKLAGIPYSTRLRRIMKVGHTKPAPSFGAPALIWHLGMWPIAPDDPLRSLNLDELEKLSPGAPYSELPREKQRGLLEDDYENKLLKFKSFIQNFVNRLHEQGRIYGAHKKEEFKLVDAEELYDGTKKRVASEVKIFKVIDPESMTFTMWWHDDKAAQNTGAPGHKPLRVRIIVQNHMDHATISLFIDAGKPWDHPPIYTLEEAKALGGVRRAKIFEHVENIRNICEDRKIYLERELLPELGLDEAKRKALFEASDYCYRQIWLDFREHFGLENLSEILEGVKIFADFRGLVLSANGFDESDGADAQTAKERALQRRIANATTGLAAFNRFDHETGDPRRNEPNAVLKAYWPFIRRVTPWADRKEFVACGVLNWRTLYVTSLGAPAAHHGDDESENRQREILGGAPAGEDAWLHETMASAERWPERRAVRYLFLTKYEPSRRQIGRIVERINALGTMRLFALKDWSAIRNASTHIRALGQELDSVFGEWLAKRRKIQEDHKHIKDTRKELSKIEGAIRLKKEELEELRKVKKSIFKPAGSIKLILRASHLQGEVDALDSERSKLNGKLQEQEDEKTEQLQYENNVAEENLIEIGANLDKIGPRATGGLVYCIARAEYHMDEFTRMVDRLKANSIDTWMSYDQFVDRGLKPSFDFIRSTGSRLRALRGRLQAVTESVQTAALVLQTSATRSNTAELRKIAHTWEKATFYSKIALGGVILSLAAWLFKDEFVDALKKIFKDGAWHSLHGLLDQVHGLFAAGGLPTLIDRFPFFF